jgi:hypothetical protein
MWRMLLEVLTVALAATSQAMTGGNSGYSIRRCKEPIYYRLDEPTKRILSNSPAPVNSSGKETKSPGEISSRFTIVHESQRQDNIS